MQQRSCEPPAAAAQLEERDDANSVMIRVAAIAMVAFATWACTVRNSEYCGDGRCTDPALRYCDVDGSFGSTPGTCIAVSCTPGEFIAYCTFTKTLLSRQQDPPAGATVADPGFRDLSARDLHLKQVSPAVDVAVPAISNPDHDLDGVARPQGPRSDLGAYEFRP